MELPMLLSEGFPTVPIVAIERVERGPGRVHVLLTEQHGTQIIAIQLARFRKRRSGEARERGQKVERGEEFVTYPSRRHHARPPRDAGYAQAAFEHGVLGAAKRSGSARRIAFGAVIAGEDDERLLREAQRTQLGENLSGAVVKFFYRIPIKPALRLAFEFW